MYARDVPSRPVVTVRPETPLREAYDEDGMA